MTSDEVDRRVRAYHEAGHAVVGHKLGFVIRRIAIVSEGQHDGTITFDIHPQLEDIDNQCSQSAREIVERYMTVLTAGGLSSLIALPMHVSTIMYIWAGCKSDRELLRHFASKMCDQPSNRDSRVAYIESAKERAWLLLEHPSVLYAIERMAELLLTGSRVIEGAEAHVLIEGALKASCLPVNSITREMLDAFEIGRWCIEDDDGKSGASVFDAYQRYKALKTM